MYCTDTDLLRWEPALFIEAAFAAHTLLDALAQIEGDRLTLRAGDFDSARVCSGHVVTLDGVSYPIISIESATTATVRLARSDPCIRCGGGSRAVVRTFAAQRQIVSQLLERMAGLEPNTAARVHDARVLRGPCVLGSLQMIYNALAASSASDQADLLVRTELYGRLYRRSLRGLVVELDGDGDGSADARRPMRPVQFAVVNAR